MSGDTSDEFQKELVDLFVQEAHEWLQNIHVALDELQQGPPPERHHASDRNPHGWSHQSRGIRCHHQSP